MSKVFVRGETFHQSKICIGDYPKMQARDNSQETGLNFYMSEGPSFGKEGKNKEVKENNKSLNFVRKRKFGELNITNEQNEIAHSTHIIPLKEFKMKCLPSSSISCNKENNQMSVVDKQKVFSSKSKILSKKCLKDFSNYNSKSNRTSKQKNILSVAGSGTAAKLTLNSQENEGTHKGKIINFGYQRKHIPGNNHKGIKCNKLHIKQMCQLQQPFSSKFSIDPQRKIHDENNNKYKAKPLNTNMFRTKVTNVSPLVSSTNSDKSCQSIPKSCEKEIESCQNMTKESKTFFVIHDEEMNRSLDQIYMEKEVEELKECVENIGEENNLKEKILSITIQSTNPPEKISVQETQKLAIATSLFGKDNWVENLNERMSISNYKQELEEVERNINKKLIASYLKINKRLKFSSSRWKIQRKKLSTKNNSKNEPSSFKAKPMPSFIYKNVFRSNRELTIPLSPNITKSRKYVSVKA